MLRPLDDGSFAVGERWVPRRVRFDEVVDEPECVVAYCGDGNCDVALDEDPFAVAPVDAGAP